MVRDHVVEVGAGAGSLTLALAETGASVVALESTATSCRSCGSWGSPGSQVQVVEGDAMALDWPAQLSGAAAWTLVANLPYNVATPLVLDLLEGAAHHHPDAGDGAAGGGGAAGGRAGQSHLRHPVGAGRVPSHRPAGGPVGPDVFLPRPGVDSVLVEITRSPDRWSAPTRSGCSSSCATGSGSAGRCCGGRWRGSSPTGPSRLRVSRPTARAEELSIHDWGRLTDAVVSYGA